MSKVFLVTYQDAYGNFPGFKDEQECLVVALKLALHFSTVNKTCTIERIMEYHSERMLG